MPGGVALACDPLDPSACMYPWPNDHFTTPDASSPTGKRLAFRDDWMPRNRLGKPVERRAVQLQRRVQPRQHDRDQGARASTRPRRSRRTGAVPITDIERSFDRDQPIVVINARTLERHLIWSELDANPADPEDVTLIIRPAVNLEEGERYIVALRNLRDASGQPPRGAAGLRARSATAGRDPAVDARRAALRGDLPHARGAPASRASELYLAWDFTVASREGLTGRALHIRDQAFAELGDTDLADLRGRGRRAGLRPASGPARPAARGRGRARRPPRPRRRHSRISGQIAVPCFLDAPGCPPGSQFAARARRPAAADPRQHRAGERRLRHPEGPRGAAAPVALRPRPARRRRRGRPARTSATWRTSTASCSARPTGPACRPRTCRTC